MLRDRPVISGFSAGDIAPEKAFYADALGIMRDQGPPIAWSKDPAGNVLSAIQD
jgi:hypothetical protein